MFYTSLFVFLLEPAIFDSRRLETDRVASHFDLHWRLKVVERRQCARTGASRNAAQRARVRCVACCTHEFSSIVESILNDIFLILCDDFSHDPSDFNRTLGSIAYNADFAHLLASVRSKDMPQVFERIAKYLGSKEFLLGATPSPADFVLYEQLVVALAMVPDALASFPTLERFKLRIEQLPSIAAYMRSDRYLARPM